MKDNITTYKNRLKKLTLKLKDQHTNNKHNLRLEIERIKKIIKAKLEKGK